MKRPNFLLILMDDLGWRDVGCYGSDFYETPNLDRLARRSMRFSDAYASCPVCSPTRASILSGKYPARLGLTQWIGDSQSRGKLAHVPYVRQLALEEVSLAKALQEGGYATWHVGKWHLGEEPYFPERHGFDVNVGGCGWGCPRKGCFAPWQIPSSSLEEAPEGTYLPDYLADQAIKLIRGRDPAKPFFLNYWDYLVHTPVQAPAHLVEKYECKARMLGLDKRDPIEVGERFACEHKKEYRVERRMFQSHPVYAAMVQAMDDNIGRILDVLEEEGIADDTVVVFTSDNGGLATAEGSPTCNAPLQEGKGWMYEGGTREPLIFYWPGVTRPDSFCDVPVTSTDFYPTLLEIAGLAARPGQHCDGVSIVPLLKGKTALDREAIFWHYPHYSNQGGTPGASVRCGDWKLIEFYEDGRLELYNLREDVSEECDRAATEPEIRGRLAKMLHDWQGEVAATMPIPDPGCEPLAHRISLTDPIPEVGQ